MVGVTFENAFFQYTDGYVDEKIMALEKDVVSVLKTAAESGQDNASKVVKLLWSAFPQHWKRLVEQARRRGVKLRMKFVSCHDDGVHHEIAKYFATISHRWSAIKAASLEAARSAKKRV